MRFTIQISKVIEIDTDRDWGGDLDALYEALRDQGFDGIATAGEIEEALSEMAADDLDAIIGDHGIESIDLSFAVPSGTTLKIPSEDEAA